MHPTYDRTSRKAAWLLGLALAASAVAGQAAAQANAIPMQGKIPPRPAFTPPPGVYQQLPQGPGCTRNPQWIADTSPCMGPVMSAPITIQLRLKKAVLAPLGPRAIFYVPGRPSVAVVSSPLVGSGTAVNSQYSFTAAAPLCVNTGVTYAIRVYSGTTPYDVGGFTPTNCP